MGKTAPVWFLAASLVLLAAGCGGGGGGSSSPSSADQALLDQIALNIPGGVAGLTMPDPSDLPAIPQDPNNPLTAEKVALGRLLYHETALLTNPIKPQGLGSASCASCHNAQGGFSAGRFQGLGEGGRGFGFSGEARHEDPAYAPTEVDSQPVKSPSTLNSAYQPNLHWNGELGSGGLNAGTQGQWMPGTPTELNNLGYQGVETQAIAALRIHRMGFGKPLSDSLGYTALFDAAFPTVPPIDRYSDLTVGLALAAYERTLLATRSPWQRWLRGDFSAMTEVQKRGAGLFFGKAECWKCHSGPALTDGKFHAIGLNGLDKIGIANNAGPAAPENLGRGGFTKNVTALYQFKTPQLYNLADTSYYGHGASFTKLAELIQYKNLGIPQSPLLPPGGPDPLFHPLGLSVQEVDAIAEFLQNALRDPELLRYVPSSTLSGHPFPNNDP
ncbi:MAG: cytochrome-c peroxidase [Armatimonadetes bacterium]|nr:cytochrome-c peroxidase [Armatimonadota bacterium]